MAPFPVRRSSGRQRSTLLNDAPTARLTPDFTITLGEQASLFSSTSDDPNGDPITQAHTLLSKPGGSAASLTIDSETASRFTPDVAGEYVVRNTVTDDGGALRAPVGVTLTPLVSTKDCRITVTGVASGTVSGEPEYTDEPRLLTDPNVFFIANYGALDYLDRQGVTDVQQPGNQAVADYSGLTGSTGKAFRGVAPAGYVSGKGYGQQMWFEGMSNPIDPQEEVYLRYRVYFGSQYKWTNSSGKGGGKLPGLGGKIPGTGATPLPGGGQRFENGAKLNIQADSTLLDNMDSFSFRLLHQPDMGLSTYFYGPDPSHLGPARGGADWTSNGGSYAGWAFRVKASIGSGANAAFVFGWNTVELRCRLNTPGSPNGIAEIWVNGVKGLSLSNLIYRSAAHPDVKITTIMNTWFYGGAATDYPTSDSYIYLDDWVASTAYVGPKEF